MRKLIINCKTNDEIKYGVCVESELKLNNNALELELTNEELNMLADRLGEFRDKINGLNKISGTVCLENYIYNKDNSHYHYLELSKEIEGLIDKANNILEINEIILKNELSKYGFKFDEDGCINNFQEILEKLKYHANSLKGDEKYKEVQKVKEIEELIYVYGEYLAQVIKMDVSFKNK